MASVRSELDRPANELTGLCSASEASGASVWLEPQLWDPLSLTCPLTVTVVATLVVKAPGSHVTMRLGANPWPGGTHTSAWGRIVSFCFFKNSVPCISHLCPVCFLQNPWTKTIGHCFPLFFFFFFPDDNQSRRGRRSVRLCPRRGLPACTERSCLSERDVVMQ